MKEVPAEIIRLIKLLDPRRVADYKRVFSQGLGLESIIDSAILLDSQIPREALTPTIEMLHVAREFKRYGYHWCNSGSSNISYSLDAPQNSKLKTITPKEVPDYHPELMSKIKKGELRYEKFDDILSKEGIRFDHIKGELFLVTGTGARMGEFGRNPKRDLGIIRIDNESKGYYIAYGLEDSEPTSDFILHLSLYNTREQIGKPIKAILHQHGLNITKVASLNQVTDSESLTDLLRNSHQDVTAYLQNGVGYVEPIVWAAPELIRRTSEEIRNHDAVVWDFHGPLSIGERFDHPRESTENPEIVRKIFDRAKGRLETLEAGAYMVLKSGYSPEDFRTPKKEYLDALRAKVQKRGK